MFMVYKINTGKKDYLINSIIQLQQKGPVNIFLSNGQEYYIHGSDKIIFIDEKYLEIHNHEDNLKAVIKLKAVIGVENG